MLEEIQAEFYKRVGQALTVAMQQRRITVTRLSALSGEHHKTIRGIMEGKPFYAHQSVWLNNVMGVDLNKIISSMRGGAYEQEIIQGKRVHTTTNGSGAEESEVGQTQRPEQSGSGSEGVFTKYI
jgi:hypothetical protein